MTILWILLAIFAVGVLDGQVVELDDRFLEMRGQHAWLVEFYAPWCGHCKKLEPIYHQVSLELKNSGVKVGRADATRYTALAQTFNVHGFPTIMFFEGQQAFMFYGDRSKESIMEFALRAKKPRLHTVPTSAKFKDVLKQHRNAVFMLYVGKEDIEEPLWLEYSKLADNNALKSYFYYGPSAVLPEEIEISKKPTVIAFKDHYQVEFEETDSTLLEKWFNSERYLDFPLINGPGLNEMSDLNKLLVIVVTDSQQGDQKQQEEFKQMVKDHLEVYKPAYRRQLQFLWMSESSSMSRLTQGSIGWPALLVLNTSTQEYYLPTVPCAELDSTQLGNFLSDVLAGTVTPIGGGGFFNTLSLFKYDLIATFYAMFNESPIMATMVFGLPCLVVGFLCYLLCIMNEEQELDLDDLTEDERREILEQRVADGDWKALAQMKQYGYISEEEYEEYRQTYDAEVPSAQDLGGGDGPRQRTRKQTKEK